MVEVGIDEGRHDKRCVVGYEAEACPWLVRRSAQRLLNCKIPDLLHQVKPLRGCKVEPHSIGSCFLIPRLESAAALMSVKG